MVYVILALVAGVTIVINRIINANLAHKIGLLQGTFFNYLTGLITALIVLVISNEVISINRLGDAVGLPWWAYMGGAVGVIVVGLSSCMNAKTSAFYLTLFMFVGQLFVGTIIDYMRVGTVSMGQIIGGVLVLAGLTYNLRTDKKMEKELEEENKIAIEGMRKLIKQDSKK